MTLLLLVVTVIRVSELMLVEITWDQKVQLENLVNSDHKAVTCKIRLVVHLRKKSNPRLRLRKLNSNAHCNNDTTKTFCDLVVRNYKNYTNSQCTDSMYSKLTSAMNDATPGGTPKEKSTST